MQLNEILEENTVKSISNRTNISENNIDALVAADFDKIKKVKTMGFISIIEREYGADLSALKAQAEEYYSSVKQDERVTLGMPIVEEKKGKSGFFKFIVLLLIAYAIWYAFVNFDKEKLGAILPFSEEKLSEMVMPGNNSNSEETIDINTLSIENVNTKESTNTDDTNSAASQ